MRYKVSVCIPTWCRRNDLNQIVERLVRQSVSQDDYEILICDSYSNDGTNELMHELTNKYSNLRYLNTEHNVVAAKRNMGIKCASAPIIVFIDDDVYPTENFIETHLKAHSTCKNIVYCGQVRFPKDWVDKSNYYRFRDSCHINRDHRHLYTEIPFNKIVTMNFSFKKEEILTMVGVFDERFIGYGGEDIEFGYRIFKSGIRIHYLEDALGYHRERSSSIVEFGCKIHKDGRDGCRVLNLINPDIIKRTRLSYIIPLSENDSLICRIRRRFYNIVINRYLAELICKFLVLTDDKKHAYFGQLYRYYMAFKYIEGTSQQKLVALTLEDVRHGWYNQ